ncbi:MAG: sulfatase-like hydrolase/transferase [Pseudomonadales bacterium]
MPKNSDDNAFVRKEMAGYYDEIARADRNIGAVINILRQQSVLDNTLIVFLSDNGSAFGNAKTTLYDEGIKTPLVMRFPPRISANVVNEQLVSAVDLMPTILSLVGVPRIANAPGVSLWPTLQNPQRAVRDYIYAESNKHGHPLFARAIRTKQYLYKRNYYGRRLCDPYWDTVWDVRKPRNSEHAQFYNLINDPQQQVNEIDNAKYAAPLAEARAKMSAIMAETHQSPPPLILEACNHRAWFDRIVFSFPEE